MAKSLLEGVREWLDRAGYPLELYVTSVLKDKEFNCSKSAYFPDPQFGKSREIDVLAWTYCENGIGQRVHLNLVIECKKSHSAFVALCTDSEEQSLLKNTLFRNLELIPADQAICGSAIFAKQQTPSLFVSCRTPVLNAPTRCGYALVHAHQNSDAATYDDVHKLAKALEHQIENDYAFKNAMLEDKSDKKSRKEMKNTVLCHLPVLVVDAPLVDAYLGNTGELLLVERDFSVVNAKLPWRRPFKDQLAIPVITKARFPDFVTDLRNFARMIVEPNVLESGLRIVRLSKKEKKRAKRRGQMTKSSEPRHEVVEIGVT